MSTVTIYKSDGTPLEYLYQWDVNQTASISGVSLSPAPVAQFYNRKSEYAVIVVPTVESGNLIVDIPNSLLQEAETIYLYLYYETDADGDGTADGSRTAETFMIPVYPRFKPEGYEYEDNVPEADLNVLASQVAGLLGTFGDLDELTTTNKSSLVDAINEINSTSSATYTYDSSNSALVITIK